MNSTDEEFLTAEQALNKYFNELVGDGPETPYTFVVPDLKTNY